MMERRLAAIMAADVVGYSRLMGNNETATLDALRELYANVIEPNLAVRQGRIVKKMGDGFLAEFPSAVEAVLCAVDLQNSIREAGKDIPLARRVVYRIGINIGDVVSEEGDIFGDGVNLASRLEGLASPGGICISANVYEQLSGKIDLNFRCIGPKSVKNFSAPIAVWEWLDSELDIPIRNMSLPEQPSIAVMPFLNLSDDPEQEFFADGMAEDAIAGLSRFRWLFVIARGSTFSYKGRSVETKQVGSELGVRYLVEGSVRKFGERIRVGAQLTDAKSGRHIWSERYDRKLDDLFALQDEITEAIVASIEPEIGAAERERYRRRLPANLDCWGLYHRALWHFYEDWTRGGVRKARELLEKACDLDPEFAAAYAELVFVLVADVVRGFAESVDETLETAEQAAAKAVSLDSKDPAAHCAMGRILIYKQEFAKAISEMDVALKLSSSSERAHYCMGLALLYSGQPSESISQFEEAIRLNPRSPMAWAYFNNLGRALFVQGKYREALEHFETAVEQPGATFLPFANLAATLGHLGEIDRARNALSEVLKRNRDFTETTIEKTIGSYGKFSAVAEVIDGLHRAGLCD